MSIARTRCQSSIIGVSKIASPYSQPASCSTITPALWKSAEDLESFAREELGRVLRQLGVNLRHAFTASPAEPERSAEGKSTPGLDLLAAITGTPRTDLDAGGAAVVESLRRYASDIGGTVAGPVSGDAARIARAQARMADCAATLRAGRTERCARGG